MSSGISSQKHNSRPASAGLFLSKISKKTIDFSVVVSYNMFLRQMDNIMEKILSLIKRVFNPVSYRLMVTIHMKGGENIHVLCDDINIKTSGGDLTEYTLTGAKAGHAMYFRIDEIVAITYKRN